MKIKVKKAIAGLLAAACVTTLLPFGSINVRAASKTPALSETSATVTVGDKLSLKVSNITSKMSMKWKSSNTKIADVNQKGVVSTKNVGKAIIACRVKSSKSKAYTLKCRLTVSSKAEVRTQAQLEKALKNAKVKTIAIRSSKARTFMIPAGNYSSKGLVVKVPNAEIQNNGVFRAITIKAVKSDTWHEYAKGNIIKITAPKAHVVAEAGAEIQEVQVLRSGGKVQLDAAGTIDKVTVNAPSTVNIKVTGTVSDVQILETAKVTMEVDGTVGSVTVDAPSVEMAITGSTQTETAVEMKSGAKNTSLTTNTKVKVKTVVDVKIVLEKGAEGSSITLDSSDAAVDVKNSTDEIITVETPAGKTEVGSDVSQIVPGSKKEPADAGNTGNTGSGSTTIPAEQENPLAGYTLKWEDNFDGDSVNTADWNYEAHEPGWVNAEWQRYVSEEENETSGNITVKDGNLIIQAKKTQTGTDENGNPVYSYTSGRINTQNKQDYKYGRFEARIRVPSGMGFLPAFWMMPTDENLYGQWPKCGEIDIMEVMGQTPNLLHSTLHFGEPHTQKQKSYTLADGDFASDFHVFACEWEPGEMRFYVDGILYHTENDWFTKREGYGEVAYPAPYDQPFYIILNLAVGGSWVGYPDETTQFGDNAQLVVDYVRVYQKDSYDENVQKPEAGNVELRDPDASGNYVINGDFAVAESLEDDKDWQIMFAEGGAGSASISDNTLHIETTNAGNVDYSVQIVQPNIPLEKGYKYKLSFDACADEARTIKTGITAPDLNYSRYLNDTVVSLTKEKQSFSYSFNMNSNSDANGRIEFNLGAQNSTAAVHISNVRLEKIGAADEVEKSVLPDGNYIYNGGFEEGSDRMDYWTVEKQGDAQVSVTNVNNKRELQVTASAENQVSVWQDIAISGGKEYLLTFDAYAAETAVLKAEAAGNTYTYNLTSSKTSFKEKFTTGADVNGSIFTFLFGAGTTYIDNVRIQEDGMIINGDFSNGTVGYDPYIDSSASASYGVDELTENGAFCMDISDTGDADWKIQLKQNNITLESGKWYEISFKAKSSLDRAIMYALQRDGSKHNDDWTPYCQDTIQLSSDYITITKKFKMNYDTDEEAILSISMGAVNGIRITEQHRVAIDDIALRELAEGEIPEDENPESPYIPVGEEILTNGSFSDSGDGWYIYVDGGSGAAADDPVYAENKADIAITNMGTEDYHIQFQHTNAVTLEKGCIYQLKFKASSTAPRSIKAVLQDPDNGYKWYGGSIVNLTLEEQEFTIDFTVWEETSSSIKLVISMGQIKEDDGTVIDTPVSTVTLSDFSLIKTADAE